MQVDSGGIMLNVELYGPQEGKPVLLLHGFPDTGRVWSKQIGPLTEAGFRLIVPDQRGYGHSDQPGDTEAYQMARLAADPVAILDQIGAEKAAAVGHDWGANVAWSLATLAPQRVDRLAALSVGHPSTLRPGDIEQRQKTWYMLLFQFEPTAENWLSDNGWANFRTWSHHPDADASPPHPDRRATPAAQGHRPHHGDMELRRLRRSRGTNDRLRRVHRRSLALRTTRRTRLLAAVGSPRRRQQAPPRLPHPLTCAAAPGPHAGHQQRAGPRDDAIDRGAPNPCRTLVSVMGVTGYCVLTREQAAQAS